MARLRTWQVFLACVAVWGTTWHAITWQLADLGPEFGVAVRFGLAGALLLALAVSRGESLRFSVHTHLVLAVQGIFLYGVSYICVYRAEQHVASGLVAVGYSASPLLVGAGAAWLFGAPISRRFTVGGVLGVVGIALVFWPEIVRPARPGNDGALGATFTAGAVLLSTVGALVSSRNRGRGLALVPAMGAGMIYGAVAALVVTAISDARIGWPASWQSWAALGWLAVAGSIVAFAAFLTLQERLGAGPAGTVGVMVPMVALVVSVGLEGFRPQPATFVGAAIALLGNALMLWPARPALKLGAMAAE